MDVAEQKVCVCRPASTFPNKICAVTIKNVHNPLGGFKWRFET